MVQVIKDFINGFLIFLSACVILAIIGFLAICWLFWMNPIETIQQLPIFGIGRVLVLIAVITTISFMLSTENNKTAVK